MTHRPALGDGTRRRGRNHWWHLAFGLVVTLSLMGCGTGGDTDTTDQVGADADGGSATEAGTGTTGDVPDLADGEPVEVTGTLTAVTSSPEEDLWLCHHLRSGQGTFALEFTARQYEVVANEVPVQLEIRDATTGETIAELGDDVAVEGIRHPDPVPVGGMSYPCEGVTGYLWVTHIERVG